MESLAWKGSQGSSSLAPYTNAGGVISIQSQQGWILKGEVCSDDVGTSTHIL